MLNFWSLLDERGHFEGLLDGRCSRMRLLIRNDRWRQRLWPESKTGGGGAVVQLRCHLEDSAGAELCSWRWLATAGQLMRAALRISCWLDVEKGAR